MVDLGWMEVFWAKTPEELREKLVKALLDDSRELGPVARRQLAEFLQAGRNGFEATIKRTRLARPTTDTLRNVAIYEAINRARYLKRVDGELTQPVEEYESEELSEGEWQLIVDEVINGHNARCKPGDRWNMLYTYRARSQAFNRGYKAAMEYRRALSDEPGES